MDAIQTLRSLLEALIKGDQDRAEASSFELAIWLRTGDVLPPSEEIRDMLREVASPDWINPEKALRLLKGPPVMVGIPPPHADLKAGITPPATARPGWPFKPVDKPPGTLPHR